MAVLTSALFALASSSFVASAPTDNAAPKVTPVLDDRGCAAYPGYTPATGFLGQWIFEVNQCVNGTAPGEPCSIEGWGPSIQTVAEAGDQELGREGDGYVTIVYVKDQAKPRLRCNDAIGTDGGVEVYTGLGETYYSAVNIANKDPGSAPIMWGLSDDAEVLPIEPYRHHVDGEEVEGTFLGSGNVTRWGVKYYDPQTEEGFPYWFFRLLQEGAEELGEGESDTFIKVAVV